MSNFNYNFKNRDQSKKLDSLSEIKTIDETIESETQSNDKETSQEEMVPAPVLTRSKITITRLPKNTSQTETSSQTPDLFENLIDLNKNIQMKPKETTNDNAHNNDDDDDYESIDSQTCLDLENKNTYLKKKSNTTTDGSVSTTLNSTKSKSHSKKSLTELKAPFLSRNSSKNSKNDETEPILISNFDSADDMIAATNEKVNQSKKSLTKTKPNKKKKEPVVAKKKKSNSKKKSNLQSESESDEEEEEEENASFLRRSKRIKLPADMIPVYEYVKMKDFQGNIINVQTIVDSTERKITFKSMENKELLRRKKINETKKKSRIKRPVEDLSSDEENSNHLNQSIQAKINANDSIETLIIENTDTDLNETIENFIIEDDNGENPIQKHIIFFYKNLESIEFEYTDNYPGIGISALSINHGYLCIDPMKSTKTQVFSDEIEYVLQRGNCIISINSKLSKIAHSDILNIPPSNLSFKYF